MQNFIPKHRMAPRGSLHDWVKVSHHPLVLFNDEHLVWLCICVFYLVNHFLADGALAHQSRIRWSQTPRPEKKSRERDTEASQSEARDPARTPSPQLPPK